jgi:glutathione peroxidase
MENAKKRIYDFEMQAITGFNKSMADFRGKVLLIVNTASKCGFTPQYDGLQKLYDKYRERGFVVLGFPSNQFMEQEPGNDSEIKHFCEVNFNITFPLFSKIDVKGPDAHPLYKYLTKNARGILGTKEIKWNFTKFLVDRNGGIVKRYAPATKPEDIDGDIAKLL